MLAFVACAMSAQLGKPPRALPEEPERYTVDGVALGMTLEEVRERWGDFESHLLLEGSTRLTKPGRFFLDQSVLLNDSGKVVSVTGYRLCKGERLLLGAGQEFESGKELGRHIDSNRIGCGNPGPMRGYYRELNGLVLNVRGWNPDFFDLPPGATLADVLQEHPELERIQSIELTTIDSYNRVRGDVLAARLKIAVPVMETCRGISHLLHSKLSSQEN